jgi:hypothetical protein
MEKTIKVARHRNSQYTVNYPTNNGGVKAFIWAGSKGTKIDTKELPPEVVEYLLLNSMCFKEGELKIVEDSEEALDVIESIEDVEEYRNNSHTKDEAIKLLEGNFNKLKSELNKVTSKQEKKFFVDVAKEIKLDSNSKLKFLSDWYGVSQDILFGE